MCKRWLERVSRGAGHVVGAGRCGQGGRMCKWGPRHQSGAQDMQMKAEMCKRRPGWMKEGWEARCVDGRGQGCIRTAQDMGMRHRMTVGGLGGSGQMWMCMGMH